MVIVCGLILLMLTTFPRHVSSFVFNFQPGTDAEIQEFIKSYDVEFPVFGKVFVVWRDDMLYKGLC